MAKHGTHMGFTLSYRHPSDDLSFDIARAQQAGVKWIRWGTEITDSMTSDPNSTSAAVTLDLTDLQAQIDQIHNAGLRVMLAVLGVPRKVNSNAGSSDPASGGRYHWFATNGTGRTIVANYTADVAQLLDPTKDIIQLGNELNNGSFNHDGSASPGPGVFGSSAAVVATQMAEQVLAVRAAVPTLKIAAGAIMNYGDIYNGTDTGTGIPAPNWVGAMLASTTVLSNGAQTGTALKTGAARPDYWTHHNYTGSAPPTQGWVLDGSNGPSLTSGYGYGTPQMLLFRAVLGLNGVQAPDGSEPKIGITEYGTHRASTQGSTTFTESIQNNYVGQYVYAYEIFKNDGWMTCPSFYYTHTDEGGDDKGLFRRTSPYAPYQAGTQFTAWANAEESAQPPPPVGPVAKFTMSRSSGVTPLTVAFTDTSTNSPTSWAWDFTNNGSTDSTSQNPSHTYTGAGTYVCKLTATNAGGSSTVTHTITVTGTAPPPTAGGDLDVLVEIGIPPTINNTTDTWIIEDPTRGDVDGPWVMADDLVWTPVTSDVQSVDIERGRNRDLDRTEAGTCTIVLRNDRTDHGTAGDYDPFNWSSPFFPYLGPRGAEVRVSMDGIYMFGGDISDMPVDDIRDNVVTTTINAVDKLGRLNKPISYRPEYNRDSGDGTHTAAKRIARLLERAGWEGDSFLFTGVNTYQTGTLQEGTALDMIQDVAASEGGMAYVSQQGNSLNFIDRNHMAAAPPLFTLSDDPTEPLRYSAVKRNMGLDLLYNTITIHPLNPKIGKDGEEVLGDRSSASAHDDVSAALYGERPYEVTWPIATLLGRTFRANELLADYKNPALRFETVTIPAAKYSAVNRRSYITGQEVGHVLTVERTPPGGGIYSLFGGPITVTSVIIGIRHHIEPHWAETTFTLTNQWTS